MAWKKNDDISEQIFDFIFAQQELPPNKRKPIKPTGVSGNSELINAVAAILENPGAFEVNQMIDDYSDAINIKLAELRFSEDNIKKADIGIANLADIIRDPVGYARKVRDTGKAIRKSMNAKYLGAMATEFVLNAYLQKKGFSKELRDIIKNDSSVRDSIKNMYEFSDFEKADAYSTSIANNTLPGGNNEFSNKRTAELRAKLSMSKSQWEGLSSRDRSKLITAIATDTAPDVKATFESVMGTNSGGRAFLEMAKITRKYSSYSDLEQKNIRLEMSTLAKNHLHNGRWDSNIAEIEFDRLRVTHGFLKYSSGLSFLSGSKTSDLIDRYGLFSRNIAKQITDIKSELISARRRGDRSAQLILNEQLKLRKATQREMLMVNVTGNIGRIEGALGSIKAYWNLESVIKGDFFKSSKNQFYCPTKKEDFEWASGRNNKVGTLSEFMIPAADPSKFKLLNARNEIFAGLYYLTPGSIFRTFFVTGEGFAFRAYNQRKAIEKFLQSNAISGFNLSNFARDALYRESVLNGSAGITNSVLLKMLRKYETSGNLVKMFGTMYRVQNAVLEKVNSAVIQNFREKLFNSLMRGKVFSSLQNGSVAKILLGTWKKGGGIRSLIMGLTHAVAEFAGITLTPIINFLIRVVGTFLAEKIYDLAVPLFGVVVYALIGIVGLIGFLAFGTIKRDAIRYDIAASTTPGAVGYCEADDYFAGSDNEDFYGTPIDIPAPINSTCPLGEVPYACTQGYSNTTCTHSGIISQRPVDIGLVKYFYAPKYCDTSKCSATSNINPSRCSDQSYTGQWTTFLDEKGNTFILGHTKLIPPSSGRNYKGGEPVAYVYQSYAELIADDPLQITTMPSDGSFNCWTGSHIHLTIQHNGSYIDPISFLVNMGCMNGPSVESECRPCNNI